MRVGSKDDETVVRDFRVAIDVFEQVDHPFRGIGRYERYLAQAMISMTDSNSIELFLFCPLSGRRSVQDELAPVQPQFRTVRLTLRQRKLLWMVSNLLHVPLDSVIGPVDVFHAPDIVGPYLKNVPLVSTVHDMAPWLFPDTRTWRNSLFLKTVFVKNVRRATRIIADSMSTKRDLCALVPEVEGKTVPVHLAPSASYKPDVDDHVFRTLASRIGLASPFVLAVSTLEPRKNYPMLLEAFATLIASEPGWEDTRLVVVGKKGWRYEDIFATARRLCLSDRVIWTSELSDAELCQLYVHCQVFTMPSRYEGFGLPVLEAMACGAPVVISTASALVEVAGDAALTVDPNRVGDLVEALRSVMGDSRQRQELRRRGLERARDFSWEKTGRATLNVYGEAIRAWTRNRARGDG